MVYAPVTGEVSTIIAEQGELVGSGYPVVAILDLTDLWVTFNVKETQLPGLRIGTRMNGYVPALDSDVEFEVTYISPQADFATWSATRTQGGFDIRTFAIKAKAVTDALGCAAVADDSGLVVDALNGEPGVYSARYGPGHDASDADRYNYLLNKLGDEKNRSARFVCCICCTMPDGTVLRSRGECEGEIMHGPKGDGGFGYDPVFKPDAVERGMAELTPDEKNAISHRGKALRAFAEELKRYYNGNNK